MTATIHRSDGGHPPGRPAQDQGSGAEVLAGRATGTKSAADTASATRAEIELRLAQTHKPETVKHGLVIAGIVSWAAFAAATLALPDRTDVVVEATGLTGTLGALVALAWALSYGLSFTSSRAAKSLRQRLSTGVPWLLATGLWFLTWELTTAKSTALPRPYFTPPQQVLGILIEDRVILAESVGNSLLLLTIGLVIGLLAGLVTGVTSGWSKTFNYWQNPFLQIFGPLPSVAWTAIVFVVFPTAYAAAVFLIAVSVWFPVAVLTRAGIIGIPRSYYDVAQTLGASRASLITRVALPGALPDILTGLFMALGVSFVSLTVAENFGVQSGIGWYINWQKGWGDYTSVYAGILVLVALCSGLLAFLGVVRARLLRWQKGLTRW
ncbi:NitT/TauT family transport system permease protein [Pseudoclavibacter sp. JAI123]|uniref:ABC transporter permease n=1 Tax=Pseudoclavibacter sp. JAI123 TaxID=2723065 RepID=UPI0015CC38FF|nr:ABC transporter permease subunit [Pseudoclavibacter sp. JAI123]NYF13168.1 NitT/TauT family transport system permease protein [Pseudoclavibacter sp. JAI123]